MRIVRPLMVLLLIMMEGCGTPRLDVAEEGRLFQYDGVPGETALVTLKRLARVETRALPFGEFVVAIDGLVADGDTSFWAFSVNGARSRRGAGDTVAAAGDRFEWRWSKR